MMMEERQILPFTGPLDTFPSSEELPEGVSEIQLKDTFVYSIDFQPNIVYAERSGEKQQLHLLLPTKHENPETLYPLIVFIQGSAWHRQNVFQHLSHMVRVCEKGYAVALVAYRPSDIAPFPAQVIDAKTAIRFLRKNAPAYHLDETRIALWGDSSGAHTAVMAGITGDSDPDSDMYNSISSQVNCIVDWYGPMDIAKLNDVPSVQDHIDPESPEGYLIGKKNVLANPELVAPTIPMNYLRVDKETPPILILHGSRDQLVNFNQGCLLYHSLKSFGKEVEMVKINGAFHGFGGFNCDDAIQITVDFIAKHLR